MSNNIVVVELFWEREESHQLHNYPSEIRVVKLKSIPWIL